MDIDSSFGAAVFVGFHAREGTANAVLSHTFTGRMTVSPNGISVSGGAFDAASAGDLGVPVVFLSGDQTACAQAKETFGPTETVAVKEALGFETAKVMAPEKSQALICAGVRKAVERRNGIKPFKVASSIKVELQFKNPLDAEIVSHIPVVTRLDGYTVLFPARDMSEASRFERAVTTMKP